MPSKFEACHDITAKWEGGWSDHPDDPGGKTMYGITQATLSEWLGRPATAAEIRSLTKDQALAIYRDRYWKRIAGDSLPAGVDLCIYDFGVNSGQDRSVRSLQATLGVKADGWVGELTLSALRLRDADKLINDLCDRRLAFLQTLKTWKKFGKGWANRVADIRRRALAMASGTTQPQPNLRDIRFESAKAVPPAPTEKTVSADQAIGAVAGVAGTATVALGPLAGFWRDNKDVLTDPSFLVVAGLLTVVVAVLLLRRPKSVEAAA